MSRHTGQVKWFSRDRGLGFIRELKKDSESSDENDIFVHYTGLRTSSNDVYKTLYDGEYIEFVETSMEDGRKIATDITGIYENELMCENVYKKKQNSKNRKRDNEDNDDN